MRTLGHLGDMVALDAPSGRRWRNGTAVVSLSSWRVALDAPSGRRWRQYLAYEMCRRGVVALDAPSGRRWRDLAIERADDIIIVALDAPSGRRWRLQCGICCNRRCHRRAGCAQRQALAGLPPSKMVLSRLFCCQETRQRAADSPTARAVRAPAPRLDCSQPTGGCGPPFYRSPPARRSPRTPPGGRCSAGSCARSPGSPGS